LVQDLFHIQSEIDIHEDMTETAT